MLSGSVDFFQLVTEPILKLIGVERMFLKRGKLESLLDFEKTLVMHLSLLIELVTIGVLLFLHILVVCLHLE